MSDRVQDKKFRLGDAVEVHWLNFRKAHLHPDVSPYVRQEGSRCVARGVIGKGVLLSGESSEKCIVLGEGVCITERVCITCSDEDMALVLIPNNSSERWKASDWLEGGV